MYLEFFKLKQLPFRLSPDPQFVYWSPGHSSAMASMKSALARAGGCAVVVGEHGAGKTLLLESLLSEETRSSTVARVNWPPGSVSELIEIILRQLEPESSSAGTREPQVRLSEILAAAATRDRPVWLLVDDAHLLSEPVLSAVLLRQLAEPTTWGTLRILLTGQLALADVLGAPVFAARAKALGERCQLPPLTLSEVRCYIEHRLASAGATGGDIFQPETFAAIFRETRGVPRLVNALCDAAMVIACERELRQVRLPEIQRALDDIGGIIRASREDLARSGQPTINSQAPPRAAGPVPAPSPRALARLEVRYQGKPVTARELKRGRLRIGRAPENELQIDSHFISRHHCQILTTAEMSLIEDVRSTNGLYVNDRRVRNHRLEQGDVVLIGEHELHYVDLRSAAPAVS